METVKKNIAIVTGGASGIGFAISKKFVEMGIHTILIGRDINKLNTAKDALGELCSVYSSDLSKLQDIPELINKIEHEIGTVTMLVNNAGINLKKNFEEVTDQEFQEILQTNIQSVFSISKAVSIKMIAAKKGVILNISSMAALYGIPKVIAYTAAKAGINGMTKAMAVELSPMGIRVNAIAPGFIETDMSAKALNNDPQRKQRVLDRTPMQRLGKPEDVAEAAYFLCSDAAKYITGVILPVDGGNSIGF